MRLLACGSVRVLVLTESAKLVREAVCTADTDVVRTRWIKR